MEPLPLDPPTSSVGGGCGRHAGCVDHVTHALYVLHHYLILYLSSDLTSSSPPPSQQETADDTLSPSGDLVSDQDPRELFACTFTPTAAALGAGSAVAALLSVGLVSLISPTPITGSSAEVSHLISQGSGSPASILTLLALSNIVVGPAVEELVWRG